jgi:hypothetical protein
VRFTNELQNAAETPKLGKRLLWVVGIYLISVIAFAFVLNGGLFLVSTVISRSS